MYDIAAVRKAVRNPDLAALELLRLYNRRLRGRTGIEVMEADWDNLLVLDACRYDIFREMHDLPGELKPVISQGGTSKEFYDRNFTAEEYGDTVVISANSHLQRVESRFHDRIRLFKHDRDPLWSEQFEDPPEIVVPETTADRTLETHERYPNKRLFVHMMQPHSPFLGETGEQIYSQEVTWYEDYYRANVTAEQARQAYRETLDIALPHVERLVTELPGKTVVTADHGELFGDNLFGLAGHPGGDIYLKELVTVPWLEVDADERKEIVPGSATEGPIEMDEEVKQSLRDLGYYPEK